jgi:hypothetical protein
MKNVLLALAVASSAAPALAQTPPKTPLAPPCQGPEYRQFDFWIGQWDVFGPAGKQVGESRIELHGNGCFLLENWSGKGGVAGKSLNMYDATDKQWHQAWVDSSGSRLLLDGQFADGKMVLGSSGPNPAQAGQTLQQRISWSINPDASVRQLWETSTDGGKSWSVAFDGRYVRRK